MNHTRKIWRRFICAMFAGQFALAAWRAGALPSLGISDNLQCAFWQTADGLPNHDITAIAQTTDGLIWLGTTGSTNSLVCFDGVDFIHPFTMAGGDDRQHTQLAAGTAGRLWVSKSSNLNSLVLWEHGQVTDVKLPLPMAGLRGIPLFEERGGDLWIGGSGLLLRHASGQIEEFPSFARTYGEVRQITEDKDGTIWLATSGGLVRRWHGHFDRPFPVTNGLYSVFASREGDLWLGADSGPGLIEVSPKGELASYSSVNGLKSRGIWSICEDRKGGIWLGTYSGLYTVWQGEVHLIPETDLRTSFIFSLMWDREESLWVGTADGLYCLRNKPIQHYGADDGLGPASSLSVGPSGPWVNSFSQGVFLLGDQGWKKRLDIPDASKDSRLLETSRGDLWLATELGCYHVHEGKTERLEAVGGGDVFYEDGAKTWIVNSNSLFCFQNGSLARMGQIDPVMGVTCLATNSTGGLLIGTTKGLFEWNGQLTKLLGFGKDLPGSLITAIQWEGETLWLASDNAIARYRNRWEFIPMETALPEVGSINCMYVEKENLWLGSANGLFRINREEVNRYFQGQLSQLTLVRYGKDQGMRSGYLGASISWGQGVARGNDGRLWFASKSGVTVINTKMPMNSQPSPVVIERMLLDQYQSVSFMANRDQTARVPAGTKSVEIQYAALTYIEPDKVLYRYRLLGLDSDWARVGNSRVAHFAKLTPGNYEFQVQACNAAGIWNEQGAVIRFVQEPFFYQTRAFFVLSIVFGITSLLLLTAVIMAGIHTISTRKMRRQVKLLEAQQTLDRERSRIARDIHDDVGSTLTRIVFLTELANRKPEQTFVPDGYLAEIRDTAREITRRLDEIVWVVNPRNDKLEALVSYISKLAMDQAKAAGLRCRLKMPPSLPPWPINGSMRHHLFMACKEAIHNTLKHASASELLLNLTLQEHGFQLEISDNGVGMPPDAAAGGGDGIENMQERMQAVAGKCEISSIPGHGTTVNFAVPCQKLDESLSTK